MITRGAVLQTSGSSRPYQRTRPLDIVDVQLDEPGDREVLVEVAAAGLCHSDLSVIDGSRPRPLPMLMGHEGAGVVRAVGGSVSHVAPGDHVVFTFVPACGACVPCLSGRPALCEPGAAANSAGTLLGGTRRLHLADGAALSHHLGVSCFAQHAVLSAASVVPIPAEIPLPIAALFGCAMLTGVGAVINTARVPPGSSVAIFGLGGVGMAALLGAVLTGAHPITVIDPSPTKLALALELGADNTFQPGPELIAQVREIAGGGVARGGFASGGVDFAFDAVGSSAVLAQAFAVTKRGGTTVAVGLPHPSATVELPAVVISAEERHILGSYMGSAVPLRDIPRLLALYGAGKLPAQHLLARSIPLENINEALDELAEGTTVRQVIDFTL